MIITSLYAGLLAFLFIGLSVRTLRMRRAFRIAVGDGGNIRMLRAVRAHSNFAEYVPFALILIYLAEQTGAPPILLHGLGIALLIGRVSHAFGISKPNEDFKFRVFGMVMTFFTLAISGGYILVGSLIKP